MSIQRIFFVTLRKIGRTIDYTARLTGYALIYLLIVMSIDGDLNLNYKNEDDKVQIHFSASNIVLLGGEEKQKDQNGSYN